MGKNRGVGKSCAKQDNSDRGVMPIKPKRILKIIICGICFAASLFLTTCGLDEVYYLKQVPQANISTTMNTGATVILPVLSESYAVCYKIFYRIYISNHTQDGQIEESSLNSVNPALNNDYRTIFPNTDPTSTSSGISAGSLFTRLNYFELALDGADINNVLKKDSVEITITINFPTASGDSPVMNSYPNSYPLYRSKDLISPRPNKYFFSSDDLNNFNLANSNINADVSGLTDSPPYAYVSMYIVAAGIDNTFSAIYSKPTFINIFKLPSR